MVALKIVIGKMAHANLVGREPKRAQDFSERGAEGIRPRATEGGKTCSVCSGASQYIRARSQVKAIFRSVPLPPLHLRVEDSPAEERPG